MSKKRNNTEEEPENPLSLSFLDALSCGLAATLALFLIFVVLPHGEMTKEASGHSQGEDAEESLSGVRSRLLKATPETAPLAVHIFVNSVDCKGDVGKKGGLTGGDKGDIKWEYIGKDPAWYSFFADLNKDSTESDNGSGGQDTGYIFGGFSLLQSNSPKIILKIKAKKITNIDKLTVNIVGAASQKAILKRTKDDFNNKDEVEVLTIKPAQKKDEWIQAGSGFEIEKDPLPEESTGE